MIRFEFLVWSSVAIAALSPLPTFAASGNAQNLGPEAAASRQYLPEAIEGEFQGRPVLKAIPKNPRGLVFLFHGSGGTVRFAQRNETTAAFKPLAGLGYGWAASQSAQREPPTRWLNTDANVTSNPDLAYMLSFYRNLVETGQISKETPIFTLGMSNGGGLLLSLQTLRSLKVFLLRQSQTIWARFLPALMPRCCHRYFMCWRRMTALLV